MRFGRVYRFLLILVSISLPMGVWAERFEIEDREGFGRAMVAKTVHVPKGWDTSGRIAWNKPCSGNDLFETIFRTQSPDGLAGARIMPGYQFLEDRAALAPGMFADEITYLMLAQSEGFNQEMATKFRGSNCAVGTVADSQTILDAVVFSNRPSGMRVKSVVRDEAGFAAIKASFGGGIPGVRLSFDALVIEMEYLRGNVPTTEWLYLSWYNFLQEPMDLGGVITSTSHTVVEPLRLVWAPTDQAKDLLPKLIQVFASMRNAPDWQRKIDEIYRKDADARRKAQAARDAESERRAKDFIDQIIWEGGGSGGGGGGGGGGSTGPVTLPEGGGAEAETDPKPEPQTENEDTDFWGEPLPETDYWGEPVNESD